MVWFAGFPVTLLHAVVVRAAMGAVQMVSAAPNGAGVEPALRIAVDQLLLQLLVLLHPIIVLTEFFQMRSVVLEVVVDVVAQVAASFQVVQGCAALVKSELLDAHVKTLVMWPAWSQREGVLPHLQVVEEHVEMDPVAMEFARMVLAAQNGAGVVPLLRIVVALTQLPLQPRLLFPALLQVLVVVAGSLPAGPPTLPMRRAAATVQTTTPTRTPQSVIFTAPAATLVILPTLVTNPLIL